MEVLVAVVEVEGAVLVAVVASALVFVVRCRRVDTVLPVVTVEVDAMVFASQVALKLWELLLLSLGWCTSEATRFQ